MLGTWELCGTWHYPSSVIQPEQPQGQTNNNPDENRSVTTSSDEVCCPLGSRIGTTRLVQLELIVRGRISDLVRTNYRRGRRPDLAAWDYFRVSLTRKEWLGGVQLLRLNSALPLSPAWLRHTFDRSPSH